VRTSAIARLAVMGILMLGLMMPLVMIRGVVSERASRRDEAVAEIGRSWGGPQTVGGPILAVPYRYTWVDPAGRSKPGNAYAYFLPAVIEIEGSVEPELRRRSLFEVVVYRSHLKVTGRFAPPGFAGIHPRPDQVQWEDATLGFGVADPGGIARRVTLTTNGNEEAFVPGIADVGLFAAGVHAPVRGLSPSTGDVVFAFEIDLNGSRHLRFLPAGDDSSVHLSSAWPHPSFVGGPLPESRQIGAGGFNATWRVPYFGRGYAPRWTNLDFDRDKLKTQASASAFGVALLQPVDIYQQAERAVKYAALFIVTTFVIAFLWEITRAVLLHPIQYLFVGFALCVFYLLLLSLSEHIGFDRAYLSAAAATIGLLAWYWGRVVNGVRQGWLMGLTLTALYGFLYMLVRLEDYALLAGSLGLFALLAIVMYLTRRVNWYDLRFGTAGGQRG
jgi:inner membrane protein